MVHLENHSSLPPQIEHYIAKMSFNAIQKETHCNSLLKTCNFANDQLGNFTIQNQKHKADQQGVLPEILHRRALHLGWMPTIRPIGLRAFPVANIALLLTQ